MFDAIGQTTPRMLNDPVLLMTSTRFDDPAEWMKDLLAQRLAACVTRIPAAESSYHWQGKIVSEHENLWLIKTTRDRSLSVSDYIKQHHRHDVPEIVIFEIAAINHEYHQWLIQNVDVSSSSDSNDS
ncbi:MAG: divalent-cation tolerance protein CutA [bacterium]|nr:divalent-cation tolerance protein CutA [bacterium]